VTDVLFYHLTRFPLERVLPELLEKTLEHGWRAVVQAGSEERVEALDQHLWTYRDELFLPHGTARDGDARQQPVYLTSGQENPNEAEVRFFVDGADVGDIKGLDRAVIIFDGRDAAAVEAARDLWRRLAGEGHDVTYWQQNERGRFERKA
jgi:DNA polymerase-3 subunit chi